MNAGGTPPIPRREPAASNPLPYSDLKPVGAADFYFAINATFRFVESTFGRDGLREYWRQLGETYYTPVSTAWKNGGLPAVVGYWRAFFHAEPEADVEITATEQDVMIEVRVCPAIRHLRAGGRKIVPCFCEHCYHVSEAMAAPAGMTVRVEGGNGSCRQSFLLREAASAPQDLGRIKEAA